MSHGFGTPMPIARSRPLQRAADDARDRRSAGRARARTSACTPSRAPGRPGIQRYAQTWSRRQHDELAHAALEPSAWACTMSLSGMFNTGHDVGGFAGPVPDAGAAGPLGAERRLQPALHHELVEGRRRVNTPWLHPEATADRSATAIRLRYRCMPYLYTLLWRAARDARADAAADVLRVRRTIRATLRRQRRFHGRPRTCSSRRSFEPGAARAARLSAARRRDGWIDFWTGAQHRGGHDDRRVAAPLERIAAVRARRRDGPDDRQPRTTRASTTSRRARCAGFPAPAAATERPRCSIEDDGLHQRRSTPDRQSCTASPRRRMPARCNLSLTSDGHLALALRRVRVVLPAGETRKVASSAPAGVSLRESRLMWPLVERRAPPRRSVARDCCGRSARAARPWR